MLWERGSEMLEAGHIGHVVVEHKPRGLLLPAFIAFGLLILAGIAVLVLVSTADFDNGPNRVPTSPGACEPFCTGTPPPPAP